MSSTTNAPIYIDGTELQLPQDRAATITTSTGIRIELAAQQPKPEPVKVVEEPELELVEPEEVKKTYKLRGRNRIQEDRLRLARAIARSGHRGISYAELHDRLEIPTGESHHLNNDLLSLRHAGVVEARQEAGSLTSQGVRYYTIPRVSQ